ncbi:MAG: ATP-binding cassette domain-containing protein [Deltaproteobacteria bacterium]|nr:ATP-binding cassette domain-containing protein [Deltaproteobacteria bacterium]MBW1919157.1 ATP-binding cassette domain-containing protein [Deltaproteobacteria bacterium]MBW1934192.1 ATP-binding cassette domain-containing protein [Deltaproteobacteria bacterium]MBW1976451.1 ATP-binding cassette domain-containing protein [Deltaproteobacteria bacterium]MBW2043686.1 ATP-binding cassette domain-containing protein [Deltaproteobacteria bacterium]
MDKKPVLMTQGVTKRFGDFVAVDRVDFDLQEKETLGIIGPNGAGKTTFINILSGFYNPEEGHVFHDGKDITHLSAANRVKMGILRTFQLVHVFDNLTVYENLSLSYFRKKENKPFTLKMFFSSLRQPGIASRVQETMEMLELDHLKDEIVGNLPLGSKKRLELAMTFVSDPAVVIFDEPFSGLGDQEIEEVIDVFRKYIHDKTILLIEHKVSKLEEFVDRLAVMHEGRIICCGDCESTLNDPEVRRCYWKLET